MNRLSTASAFVLVSSALGLAAFAPACGGSSGNGGFNSSGGSGSGSGGGSGSSGGIILSSGGSGAGSGSGSTTGDGGLACPAGLQCDVTCSGGTSTTVSGKVYDPAKRNPLYNVAVYVPAVPLEALPKGVPTGADACSCAALFKSGAITSTSTGVDGSFSLTNVPVGSSVPLVLQIGKWRKQVNINVTACKDNPQADKSLALAGTVTTATAATDSIPDIAVSTGSADTLECLMQRIGIPASEYVAGASGTGHVHVFSGGSGGGKGGGGQVGTAEHGSLGTGHASETELWADQAHLMPYDITLLSCEGGETYNANPAALESYLNAGGRAFASHYHYSWFSGPIDSVGANTYSAPADWGNNLASWSDPGSNDNGPIGGVIDQTLNGSSQPFDKGVKLAQWLKNVNALGQNGVAAGELSIYSPRYNAVVAPANKVSQPWITSDATSGSPNQTMYFSFDTPVNAPPSPDGGAPNYCGRAVFSDLHVGGDPSVNDNPPSCDSNVPLSPQERALEFMLFDLSSCVIPDTVTSSPGVPFPPPK
ncbi:MAG TPA: hypothetical protein VGI39_37415 [Polyangiaceae bacterium]